MRRLPRSLIAAYGIFGLFMLVESRLRQGEEAKSFEAGAADEGTTRLIGASFGAGLIGIPLVALSGRGRMSLPGAFGPVVMLVGLGLRIWAALVLGRFYTRTLRVEGDQIVVRDGPYQLVRHPGYLGVLLMWGGFGLSAANWLATLGVGLAMGFAYNRRIRSEEAMLVEKLGDTYREYTETTWRLVPGVY
jgi:protein-S-isoprenylcysteine O-methyltransferase Ste14